MYNEQHMHMDMSTKKKKKKRKLKDTSGRWATEIPASSLTVSFDRSVLDDVWGAFPKLFSWKRRKEKKRKEKKKKIRANFQ